MLFSKPKVSSTFQKLWSTFWPFGARLTCSALAGLFGTCLGPCWHFRGLSGTFRHFQVFSSTVYIFRDILALWGICINSLAILGTVRHLWAFVLISGTLGHFWHFWVLWSTNMQLWAKLGTFCNIRHFLAIPGTAWHFRAIYVKIRQFWALLG